MSRDENTPFQRGETFYNGGTIDSNNLGGANLEGQERDFEDLDYSALTGVRPARTNRLVTCRCVRNVGAVALKPKELVRFQNTAGVRPGRVDGKTTVTAADFAGVVDEWLPAAGVPVNDLFWLAVAGPTEILTPLEGDVNNVFAVGDVVIAHTGATSGATTSGRVIVQGLGAATTVAEDVAANKIQNRVGQAVSARTTANTNVGLLVDVFRRW